jgi:cobalamin biosynthesis Co2+ chelatase CbiK
MAIHRIPRTQHQLQERRSRREQQQAFSSKNSKQHQQQREAMSVDTKQRMMLQTMRCEHFARMVVYSLCLQPVSKVGKISSSSAGSGVAAQLFLPILPTLR